MNKLVNCKKRKSLEPLVIPKAEHGISQKHINRHAIDILKKLNQHGFESYIVGGSVRDLLLKKRPKDFDIVTNALPSQIKKIFRNCRIIGRRFRLAHIYFNSEIIEVATFRAMHDQTNADQQCVHHQGIIIRDNVYGSLEQDAARRDFTINALYYDIREEKLKDFFNGFRDLKQGVIRMIGDPEKRYREDPVRILRAIRFIGKLEFELDNKTKKDISKLISLLVYIPAARLYDEALKLFYQGSISHSFSYLQKYHVLTQLFPVLETYVPKEQQAETERFLQEAFYNTDKRIRKKQPINQAFLFAALLWPPVFELWKQYRIKDGIPNMEAFHRSARKIMQEQRKRVAIPRRTYLVMETMWRLQYYLEARKPKQIDKILSHRRFKAAYDLLLLRTKVSEALKPAADFWAPLF